MEPAKILNQIAAAGAWLPIAVVREAFKNAEVLTPEFFQAVQRRAAEIDTHDVRLQRLAAFGVFLLAQRRDRSLLEPLIRLFETVEPERQEEWLFPSRLFFFGHRLLAGVSHYDPHMTEHIAVDATLRPLTRSLALCAIGLLAAYGDISRFEAVQRLRATLPSVKTLSDEWTNACWARTAALLHAREFERELQWFLASGRLDEQCRHDIALVMRRHPDANFASILALDPMVDLFSNVFPKDIRQGELGLLPNCQIPGLNQYESSPPQPETN